MLAGILYFISIIYIIMGFHLLKKSDEMLNGIAVIGFEVLMLLCWQTVFGRLFSLVGIPVSIVYFAIVNFTAGTAFFILTKLKGVQKYEYKAVDAAALAVFAIGVLLIGGKQFGFSYDTFNFESMQDSAIHLMDARKTASDSVIKDRLYFESLNTGLLMEAIYPFIPTYRDLSVFVRNEMFTLFLNCSLFWLLIRNFLTTRKSCIFGMLMTLLFAGAYPLNSMIFGTSYLSSGIACCIALLISFELFIHRKIKAPFCISFLFLSAYGLFVSYVLFAAVMFSGIGIYFIYYLVKEKRFSKKGLIVLFSVLGILSVIAVMVFIKNFGRSFSGLKYIGYNYFNLYSNFLFFIPFLAMAVTDWIKKRELTLEAVMLVINVYIIFFCIMTSKVSIYYTGKFYCTLSLLCFYIFVKYISCCDITRFIRTYCITWAALLGIWCLDFTDFLITENGINKSISTKQIFDIYQWNREQITLYDDNTRDPAASEIFYYDENTASRRELYAYVAEYSEDKNITVGYLAETSHMKYQFFALANQPMPAEYKKTKMVAADILSYVEDNASYVCVVTNKLSEYDKEEYQRFAESFEIIYENDEGFFAKVNG